MNCRSCRFVHDVHSRSSERWTNSSNVLFRKSSCLFLVCFLVGVFFTVETWKRRTRKHFRSACMWPPAGSVSYGKFGDCHFQDLHPHCCKTSVTLTALKYVFVDVANVSDSLTLEADSVFFDVIHDGGPDCTIGTMSSSQFQTVKSSGNPTTTSLISLSTNSTRKRTSPGTVPSGRTRLRSSLACAFAGRPSSWANWVHRSPCSGRWTCSQVVRLQLKQQKLFFFLEHVGVLFEEVGVIVFSPHNLLIFLLTLLKTTIPIVIHPRQTHNKRPLRLLAQPRMPVFTDHLMCRGCLPVATVTVKQIQQ